jgi:hypothetical protein
VDGRAAHDGSNLELLLAAGQVDADAAAARYGQLRYSLWTGDPGFAIYFWDCIRGAAAFPTLDVFLAPGQAP